MTVAQWMDMNSGIRVYGFLEGGNTIMDMRVVICTWGDGGGRSRRVQLSTVV